MTLDDWLSNFSRDTTPHSELIWWEFLSFVQLEMERGLPENDRKRLFDGLLHFLLTFDISQIIDVVATLPEPDHMRCLTILNNASEVWKTDVKRAFEEAQRLPLAGADL